MEADNGDPWDQEEVREEVHAAPLGRVATWQDAFRAAVHGDQNLEDPVVPWIDDEVVDQEDHHAWDLNGGVEVRDPTFQEEDHLVQMGKATLKIKILIKKIEIVCIMYILQKG